MEEELISVFTQSEYGEPGADEALSTYYNKKKDDAEMEVCASQLLELKTAGDRILFQEKKKKIESEIKAGEKEVMELNKRKKELMEAFQPFCVHCYDKSFDTLYGDTYRECTICGHQICVYELSY